MILPATLAHLLSLYRFMLPMIVFVAVVCGLVLRRLSQEERIQLFHRIIELARQAAITGRDAVTRIPPGCDEFSVALRARTRWTLITPAIIAGFVAVHVLMRWNATGDFDDQLLLEWGASVGPLTTNAEWSRLASAMFVHRGWMHLIADTAGLLMAGALIERVVGRAAFTLIFAASGLLAGLWSLAAYPISVNSGAAGAVFGVYGLLAATTVWGFAQRSPLTIPVAALRRIWPGALVFVIYHVATEGFVSQSMRAGLLVGLFGGLILVARVSVAKPPMGRVYATTVATFAVLIAFAVPLRGIADVPAEVARVIDVEARTAALYDAKTDRVRKGLISADELATIAEAIGAEVHTTRVTLAAIRNIPVDHRELLKETSEYLRLREESWRLRVEGLRKGRMPTLQDATVRDRESMRAYERVDAMRGG